MIKYKVIAFSGVVIGLLWVRGDLGTILTLLLYSTVIAIGAYYGAASVILKGPKYQIPKRIKPAYTITQTLLQAAERHQHFSQCSHKTVISRNLDRAIQDLLNLIQQDYILPWYTDVAWNHHIFTHFIEDDAWHLIKEFSERLQKIDWVTFIAHDIMNALTIHFHSIRTASKKSDQTEDSLPDAQPFMLHPWQSSAEDEEEFLRKVAQTFLHYLLPKTYSKSNPASQILREILACSVFKSGVDIICDPDYVNEKLISWLGHREQLAAEHAKKYTYAATYEQFIEMIEKSHDIEHLKQMRYNIMSEIMQATTIQNLKRAKGLDTNRESSPKGTTKGDLLKARNLKRYLNQLSVTKTFCEKRIQSLGGPDFISHAAQDQAEDTKNIPGRKVLSFQVIMETASARQQFLKYLTRINEGSLLRFWAEVESMKLSGKRHWHQMGAEVYQVYVAPSGSIVKEALNRNITRSMETFMKGNSGPDAFWSAQDLVKQLLEEKHYASFILSDVYHRYITSAESPISPTSSHDYTDGLDIRSPTKGASFSEDLTSTTYRISEHSTYAQEKLDDLQEKISNKKQALGALSKSQLEDSKLQKLARDMEEEIQLLTREHQQLVFHIDRTDLWAVNLGKWRAHIHNIQWLEEDDGKVIHCVLIIHQQEVTPCLDSIPDAQGWVISRQLDDFHALHTQLTQIFPQLKKTRLPTLRRFRSKSSEFLLKAQVDLQEYLNMIMMDEDLSLSEAVFAFFSPSPHHLKVPTDTKSRGGLSFTNLFKNLSRKAPDSDSEDEQLFGNDDSSSKIKGRSDWIAEPLYLLIGEVFELRGVFKWLRRSLMLFVQVTFGRSINRQIRDMVDWILGEPMLIFYLQSFSEAYWPEGKLADKAPPRNDQQKLSSRRLAKTKFLNSIPDALKNLVGEGNAQRGAVKMFESLQDSKLNKHIFYVLLQLFLYKLFPELKEFQKLDQEKRQKLLEEAKNSTSAVINDSSESETDTQEDEVTERNKKSNISRPSIPVSRLHNSPLFWMRI